jgi:elongation factor P--(R)-beta-lysine ligase
MLTKTGLRKRATFIQAIRRFFIDRNYIEVDTPCRLPVLIPEAHNEPVESGDYFLQTSPEISMKRLLAETGCSKIFQICKCFRNNERGDRHLPEFTMLEWYRTYCNYQDLMVECEEMVLEVARTERDCDYAQVKGKRINLEKGWDRLTVAEAFSRYAPVSMSQALEQDIFDEMLCRYIEPKLGWDKPMFLYDYPIELGALARSKKENPFLAERFEIYIGGLELANGFSELTDEAAQQERFEAELDLIRKKGRTKTVLPQKFLGSLPKMVETSGIALGVDRLAMVFFEADRIDQVVTFVPEDL